MMVVTRYGLLLVCSLAIFCSTYAESKNKEESPENEAKLKAKMLKEVKGKSMRQVKRILENYAHKGAFSLTQEEFKKIIQAAEVKRKTDGVAAQVAPPPIHMKDKSRVILPYVSTELIPNSEHKGSGKKVSIKKFNTQPEAGLQAKLVQSGTRPPRPNIGTNKDDKIKERRFQPRIQYTEYPPYLHNGLNPNLNTPPFFIPENTPFNRQPASDPFDSQDENSDADASPTDLPVTTVPNFQTDFKTSFFSNPQSGFHSIASQFGPQPVYVLPPSGTSSISPSSQQSLEEDIDERKDSESEQMAEDSSTAGIFAVSKAKDGLKTSKSLVHSPVAPVYHVYNIHEIAYGNHPVSPGYHASQSKPYYFVDHPKIVVKHDLYPPFPQLGFENGYGDPLLHQGGNPFGNSYSHFNAPVHNYARSLDYYEPPLHGYGETYRTQSGYIGPFSRGYIPFPNVFGEAHSLRGHPEVFDLVNRGTGFKPIRGVTHLDSKTLPKLEKNSFRFPVH